MAFSGKYFCGCLKNSPTKIDRVPLYYQESDILPYCDKAIKVSAPGAYLGYLWAGAMDPTLTLENRGGSSITQKPSSLEHNFEGHVEYTTLETITINGGTYGTTIDNISFTVNANCSYGAKSDGWCGTFPCLFLDWTSGTNEEGALNYPMQQFVKSWGWGPHTVSQTINNIYISPGIHTIKFTIMTHASGGDGAYFKLNWYSLYCNPKKKNQIASIMHTVEADNKEYILCKSFG